MLTALRDFYQNSTRDGMYINSCFTHCQSETQDTWFAAGSPRIHNKVGEIHFSDLLLRCIIHCKCKLNAGMTNMKILIVCEVILFLLVSSTMLRVYYYARVKIILFLKIL